MVIDIIDPNDEQFQNLTDLEYAMIREAQSEKNSIVAAAESKKRKLFLKALARNTARSTALPDAYAVIDAETVTKVDVVREDLLHRLAYAAMGSGGNENGTYRYPENPNYGLTYSQRFLVVRDYYMHVTTNPQARLKAFEMDSLARTYLGEYYQTLYDLLASYC